MVWLSIVCGCFCGWFCWCVWRCSCVVDDVGVVVEEVVAVACALCWSSVMTRQLSSHPHWALNMAQQPATHTDWLMSRKWVEIIHPFIHPSTHPPPNHSFIHPLTHPLSSYPFIHSTLPLVYLPCSRNSSVQCPFIHSFISYFILLYIYQSTHPFIHSWCPMA